MALKIVGIVLLVLLALVVLYLLAAFMLSRIAVEPEPNDKQEVSIYILTNGVHTDLVLPVKTQYMDWEQFIPIANTEGKDTLAKYVALGWGDKGFYLETPTWADLKPSTALKAVFGLSYSAMHATFYRNMYESDICRRINMSAEQYQRLVSYVKARFKEDGSGKAIYIKTNANYGPDDAFYEAHGSYNLFYTCNTWANNGLKAAGQKASLWTPFYKGIFYHYK
ncbi:TIGR02117 family protein [Rufibacter roseus]|uniref:TIGR02117 family protein n=1 Tax=Rufibacter roseus TaxID=1567108 RepID=A0ABW2DPK8_9BACT|nr:TIGR02117 family protein [Rufibacter roseus]